MVTLGLCLGARTVFSGPGYMVQFQGKCGNRPVMSRKLVPQTPSGTVSFEIIVQVPLDHHVPVTAGPIAFGVIQEDQTSVTLFRPLLGAKK